MLIFISLRRGESRAQSVVSPRYTTPTPSQMRDQDLTDELLFGASAYDEYGPEHHTYTNHVSLQMPDSRDWEIVEALEHDVELEDFDRADVQRVQQMIMITDEQYAQLVADGKITPATAVP